MQSTAQRILESLDNPEELEALYRRDPESFRAWFDEVCQTAQDSLVLRVWKARLEYSEPPGGVDRTRLWHAIGIGLCAGALVRIPAIWFGATVGRQQGEASGPSDGNMELSASRYCRSATLPGGARL